MKQNINYHLILILERNYFTSTTRRLCKTHARPLNPSFFSGSESRLESNSQTSVSGVCNIEDAVEKAE